MKHYELFICGSESIKRCFIRALNHNFNTTIVRADVKNHQFCIYGVIPARTIFGTDTQRLVNSLVKYARSHHKKEWLKVYTREAP